MPRARASEVPPARMSIETSAGPLELAVEPAPRASRGVPCDAMSRLARPKHSRLAIDQRGAVARRHRRDRAVRAVRPGAQPGRALHLRRPAGRGRLGAALRACPSRWRACSPSTGSSCRRATRSRSPTARTGSRSPSTWRPRSWSASSRRARGAARHRGAARARVGAARRPRRRAAGRPEAGGRGRRDRRPRRRGARRRVGDDRARARRGGATRAGRPIALEVVRPADRDDLHAGGRRSGRRRAPPLPARARGAARRCGRARASSRARRWRPRCCGAAISSRPRCCARSPTTCARR